MFDEDSDELMHEGRREHAWHEWAIRKYGMEQTTSQVRISYVYGGIINVWGIKNWEESNKYIFNEKSKQIDFIR